MDVQAVIQPFVDSCISKTINLPEETKWEQVADLALEYAQSVKGLTIYRAGSKGNEPLQALPLTEENINMFVYNEGVAEVAVTSSEACSLAGGNCGD